MANKEPVEESASGETPPSDNEDALRRRKTIARRKLIASSVIGAAGLVALARYWPDRWRYIVVHHSAGNHGSIEFLQEVHRQRQSLDPIDAIPYHYVIGNGHGIGDGDIAQDWRGRWHIWGAHVSSRNSGRNYYGLGICLIGNLEEQAPTPRQYRSLVTLTKDLMARYQIPLNHVSGHGYTEGERTLCPGKFFPMQRFLTDLAG